MPDYLIRIPVAFVVGALAAYLPGAFISTQMVLNRTADLGIPVSMGMRLELAGLDLVGMAPTYLPLLAVALMIGLAVSRFALRFVRLAHGVGYMIGGASAILTLHLILVAVFEMHPLPATRSALGLMAQTLTGALGGLAFFAASRKLTRSAESS